MTTIAELYLSSTEQLIKLCIGNAKAFVQNEVAHSARSCLLQDTKYVVHYLIFFSLFPFVS